MRRAFARLTQRRPAARRRRPRLAGARPRGVRAAAARPSAATPPSPAKALPLRPGARGRARRADARRQPLLRHHEPPAALRRRSRTRAGPTPGRRSSGCSRTRAGRATAARPPARAPPSRPSPASAAAASRTASARVPSVRTLRTASSGTSACTQPAASILPTATTPSSGKPDVGRPVDRRRAGAARRRRQPVGLADRHRVDHHALALERPRRRAGPHPPVAARAVGRSTAPAAPRPRPRPAPGRAAGTRRRSRSGCRSGRARSRTPAARVPGSSPQSSRSKRLSITLSWCPWLPSGANSRARLTALPSSRRIGPDAAQTCTLNSRARLRVQLVDVLDRGRVTASIVRCEVAGVVLAGEARELERRVLREDQQLRPLLGRGADPDPQLADVVVPSVVPVDRIGGGGDLHAASSPRPTIPAR